VECALGLSSACRTNVVFNQAYQEPRDRATQRALDRRHWPLTKHPLRVPKQKAAVMLLDELAIVDCCAGVSFYAP
jgi:hypothetical protein